MKKSLLAGLILLTSCSPSAPQATFCPIAVHADACVKAWLHTQSPPDCVNEYFHKIGIEQADIDKNCR